jgi:hypothetical protein
VPCLAWTELSSESAPTVATTTVQHQKTAALKYRRVNPGAFQDVPTTGMNESPQRGSARSALDDHRALAKALKGDA